MSEMLGVISDTERLANDLSSVDLISYQVKDDVITTPISRYQKASKLLNEIERSLRVRVLNNRGILIAYCEVLKKQKNSALTRIAENMLKELSELNISMDVLIVTMKMYGDYLHEIMIIIIIYYYYYYYYYYYLVQDDSQNEMSQTL